MFRTKITHLPNFHDKGFTLIEIMIVVVIIASIFATFVPGLFSKSDRELRKEVRRIALLSKEIRNRAVLTKNTHRIVFNIEPRSTTFYPEEAAERR